MKFTPTLIPNWKASWRMFSQQCFLMIVVLQSLVSSGLFFTYVAELGSLFPISFIEGLLSPSFAPLATTILGIFGMLGRVVAQASVMAAAAKTVPLAGAPPLNSQ